MISAARQKLVDLLGTIPAGPLAPDVAAVVEGMLVNIWDELDGASAGGMRAYKLQGRTEGMAWDPPELTFVIERHGAAVLGSIHAELQSWHINPAAGTAATNPYANRRRMIGGRDAPLKVEPFVEQIATAIKTGKEDPRLVWASATRVRIKMGLVIEATNKQTTSGRRRRFINKLEEALAPGWRRVQAGSHTIFEASPPSGTP